jgi:hypothetical protein
MSRGGVADGVKPLRVLRRRQQTAPHAPPTTHSYVDGDHHTACDCGRHRVCSRRASPRLTERRLNRGLDRIRTDRHSAPTASATYSRARPPNGPGYEISSPRGAHWQLLHCQPQLSTRAALQQQEADEHQTGTSQLEHTTRFLERHRRQQPAGDRREQRVARGDGDTSPSDGPVPHDGVVVASTRASGWGKVPATIVDIAGGNDQAIARTFVVDELKLWSHANTPPRCAIAVSAGPPTQVRATIQSNRSGLAAIAVSKAVNATVAWPAFVQGTTGPVLVTATKTNQVLPAQVELQVTDRAGNVTTCDPALAEVTAHRAGAVQVFKDIPASEHVVTIMNGRPGLSDLRLLVNGRHLVVQLRAGEERTIDIAGAMHAGSNTILAIGRGRRGGSAEVMIWDGG